LTPNDDYSVLTAPLTSKFCILYIYSTNIGTEYFKHGIYSPFFSSSKCSLFYNSNVFGSCIIHILYTGCAKIKKNNSGPKRLMELFTDTGKLKKLLFDNWRCLLCAPRGADIDTIFMFLQHTRQHGCTDILHCCNDPWL